MIDYKSNYHNKSNRELIDPDIYVIIKENYKNEPIIDLWGELEESSLYEQKILEKGFEYPSDSEEFFMCLAKSLVLTDIIKARDYKEKLFLTHLPKEGKVLANSENDFEAADEYQNQLEFFKKFFYTGKQKTTNFSL